MLHFHSFRVEFETRGTFFLTEKSKKGSKSSNKSQVSFGGIPGKEEAGKAKYGRRDKFIVYERFQQKLQQS